MDDEGGMYCASAKAAAGTYADDDLRDASPASNPPATLHGYKGFNWMQSWLEKRRALERYGWKE